MALVRKRGTAEVAFRETTNSDAGGDRSRVPLILGSVAAGALLSGVGLALVGIPVWAVRRILYPMGAEPLPDNLDQDLQIEASARPERVEFEARDGKRVGGWFIPGPVGVDAPWPCVLLVYGFGGYKEQMVWYAQMLHAAGFATLLFDLRGGGLRRGEPLTMGFKERWDLIDAVGYVQTRNDTDPERLGVLGVSMGAATALLAAAEEPALKAIVSDSGYANLSDMVQPGLRAFVGRAALPFAPLIIGWGRRMVGAAPSEINPELATSQMGERPLLIIHGDCDQLVATESAFRLYRSATGPKELWIVRGCEHAMGPAVDADGYRVRVTAFFRRWLAAGDGD